MDKTKQKKLKIAKGIVATVFIFVLMVYIAVVIGNTKGKKIHELLDLGNKYIADMDYENAILVFDQVIAIDPKCEDAYLGKAKAQYALEQYEGAIVTLEAGIAIVDDSSRLEEYLQWVLQTIPYENVPDENTPEVNEEEVIVERLLLNYTKIVRRIDTEEPKIQLEVLGDEGNEGNYLWSSSNTECVSVSDTGLLTCLPVEGSAEVYVKDNNGQSDVCIIRISDDFDDEYENIRVGIAGASEDEENVYALSIVKEENTEKAVVDVVGEYIYYSGDITIPETLQFQGKKLTITGIGNWAFRWSDKLDSVYIPETVEHVGEEYEIENPFYFCTNLKEIKVDENNNFLKSEDGVLYSKDGKILYSYPAGKSSSSYTIPKEVEKVSSGAFLGCSNLKEILVEEGNEYYESVDGVLIYKQPWASWLVAYPAGSERASYTVPDSVEYLESKVFSASRLEEVNFNSVESIGQWYFYQCQGLKKISGGEKTVYIDFINDSIEIEGMSAMKNLKDLRCRLEDGQDFTEFAALESLENLEIIIDGQSLDLDLKVLSELSNLRELRLIGIDNIEDLTWLEEMESLSSIYFSVEKFTAADLTPLLNMENMQYFTISSDNAEELRLSDDVKQQIEKIKIEKPELQIRISGMEVE